MTSINKREARLDGEKLTKRITKERERQSLKEYAVVLKGERLSRDPVSNGSKQRHGKIHTEGIQEGRPKSRGGGHSARGSQ